MSVPWKRTLLAVVSESLSAMRFDGRKSFSYRFSERRSDGICCFVVFQTDSIAGAVATELAATYERDWWGAPTTIVGRSTGLEHLVHGTTLLDIEKCWREIIRPQSIVPSAIRKLKSDLSRVGGTWLDSAIRNILNDRLLQFGIAENRRLGTISEEEYVDFKRALDAADFRSDRITVPRVERLKQSLRAEAARINATKKERQNTGALAVCLVMQRLGPEMPRDVSGRQDAPRGRETV